jgi:hypothetical protein
LRLQQRVVKSCVHAFPLGYAIQKCKGNNSWVEQFIRDGKTVLDPFLPVTNGGFLASIHQAIDAEIIR